MPRSQRTPFVILGLLGISNRQPRSGYEIKKAIDTVVSSFWHESNGQIYPALKRLASSGLIEIRADIKKGRPKKLYLITPKGRERLRAWLASPIEIGRPRDELMLKLFFGSETDIPTLIGHVEAHRDRAKGMLEKCSQWEKENSANPGSHRPFFNLTLGAGTALSEANLRWAEESLRILATMPAAKAKS